MHVSDCMITEVYTIGVDATLNDAVRIMAEYRVGTLPVVNADRRVLGVLLLDDILLEFMPDFVGVLRSVDFVQDYGFLEGGHPPPGIAEKPVRDIMRPPYFVPVDSGLMAAMVLMHKHQVTDVPIVNEQQRLVGLVSYVRVGSLFLKGWLSRLPPKEK